MAAPGSLPMSVLMNRMAAHLEALADEVCRLEAATGAQLSPDTPLPAALIEEMQSLDTLRQSLADLARLSRGIGTLESATAVPAHTCTAWLPRLQMDRTRALLMSPATGPDGTVLCPRGETQIF